jgi:four helix bundle protein
MGRPNQFENLIAWQNARRLAKLIYGQFGTSKDYGFRDQVCRAAVSVMSNVAEGFERQSDKEFARFLIIAKGSCGEVRSLIILAKDLNYLGEKEYLAIETMCIETSKLIAGLIKSVRTRT